jgi:hypothetical protein
MGTPAIALYTGLIRMQAGQVSMNHLSLGTFWIIFTVGAATVVGTDFILHEIRTYLRHRRESGPK